MQPRLFATIALAVLFVVGGQLMTVAAATDRIVVLTSHNAAPYQAALDGFKAYLRQQDVNVQLDVHALEGDAAKTTAILHAIKPDETRALLALGALAMRSVLNTAPKLPLIAGLVLRSDALAQAPHATGVVLEFPVETQLQWVRRILPSAQTLGVLYNPKENQERITMATQVAKHLGFQIEAQAVHSPKDIPVALDQIGKRADVLWGITDSVVLTPQTAKHILLFSFRNRIPFIGISPTWVKSGALYALDWDYVDLGRQCGELTLHVLRGIKPSTLPPVTPRIVHYALNRRTARHMKVRFPKALLRKAQHVFK